MYQSPITIAQLLDRIKKQEYVLPAIQREFVWYPAQICRLFDSLMQGYPFGTFLFWKIKPENRDNYQFYSFMQNYHERDRFHCERVTHLPEGNLIAVLDGQQRMTALNIGLTGSYTWKTSGKRWSNDNAFPERFLYLNLLGEPDVESGSQYEFAFLTSEKAREDNAGAQALWFSVSTVYTKEEDDLIDQLDELQLSVDALKQAKKSIRLLHRTINVKPLISYYEEENQELTRVLNIFIRMNSGGTTLSYSDLLLSVAVAQWEKLDAREEIHRLVDEMNHEGDGFKFSKDLVLKAGLMLSNIGNVGFKVENFNKSNMAILETNWESIRHSMLLSVSLLSDFGFSSENIRADSAILPVAYYLHFSRRDKTFLTRSEFSKDRENIRRWLIRSLLKSSGIWGSGLDTLLTELRSIITEHGETVFPVQNIETAMSRRGKSLAFSDDEIEELAELEYGNHRTFALLSLLFPGFDFSHQLHIDHIYPKGRFTSAQLRKIGIAEGDLAEIIYRSNCLPNLQLLVGAHNNEKREKMPHEWYEAIWPDAGARKSHLQLQLITTLPESISEFSDFYQQRKQLLINRIQHCLRTEQE